MGFNGNKHVLGCCHANSQNTYIHEINGHHCFLTHKALDSLPFLFSKISQLQNVTQVLLYDGFEKGPAEK